MTRLQALCEHAAHATGPVNTLSLNRLRARRRMLLRSMSLLFPSCLAVVDAPTVAASLQGCLFTTMLWDSGDSEGGEGGGDSEGGKGNEGSEGGAFTDNGVDDLRLAVLSHCMARPSTHSLRPLTSGFSTRKDPASPCSHCRDFSQLTAAELCAHEESEKQYGR